MFAALKILAYVSVALVCAHAAHRAKNDAPRFGPGAFLTTLRSALNAIRRRGRAAPPRAWHAVGWSFVAAVCLGLAIARAIDVDAWIHARAAEVPEAVYAVRHEAQRVLVWGFVGLGAVVLAVVAWLLRGAPRLAIAVGAALALVGYSGVRWVSLHAVDVVVGRVVLGVRINTWIEVGLLVVIVVAAGVRSRRDAKPR